MADHRATPGPTAKRIAAKAAPWVLLVMAKLWLVGGQRLTAYGSLTIDDEWFVQHASSISAGKLSIGALWLVREEWMLLLPALVCGLALSIVRLARVQMPPLRRVAAAGGVACIPLSVVVGTLWLERVNDARYGVAITNVEQTSMSDGLGPMFRVSPATTFDQFPVTTETRKLIYDVSPTLAALRGEIETGVGSRFSSLRPDGVRDLGGQVFQWVVLDAIGATGRATTLTQLADTFHSIAREIDTACDDARLRCGPAHRGIAPAWKWSRLPALTVRTLTGLRMTIDLGAFTALSPDGDGTADDRALFSRFTNEPLAPGPNTFLTRQRVHLISVFRWLYRLLSVAAIVVITVKAWSALHGRRVPSWPMSTVLGVGVLLVVVRVVGLSYLDLTAFPAFAPPYLASAYAVCLVIAVAVALGNRATVVQTS